MNLVLQADAIDSTQPAGQQLHALLHRAGFAPLTRQGWLRVSGEDRVRWLNGMVTNSIRELNSGEGNFSFILSAQGRIQGTATAFALDDCILLEIDRAQLATLTATLDRFIIMDDVELTNTTDDWTGLAVIGPIASALLQQMGLEIPIAAAPSLHTIAWQTSAVTLIIAHSPLVPRFELWGSEAVIVRLSSALEAAGAAACADQALEELRILEGTPRYGTDIRDKELPQETAQTHALHFAKGCYLGQEIVERIRSRGNVHRTFTGFRLTGALPAAGALLEADGKQAGELTSVVSLPAASGGTLQLALGYIRREALDRAATLTYPGGEAVATPTPFEIL